MRNVLTRVQNEDSDIIKVKNNETIPADFLLLYTS